MKRVDFDLLIVGAGPVGLYGAYYAGVRGLRTAVLDSLPEKGGQVSALYPEKPIYDIAGFPEISGRQLVDGLVRQAERYAPSYLLGQSAVTAVSGQGAVEAVEVTTKQHGAEVLTCQRIVAALGFLADLGPLRHWGLELHDNRHITVDSRMRTSLPRIYAAGDVTNYQGKVRLISVGFGEVATAVNNAAVQIDPSALLFPGHSTDAALPAAV
jgi:thioredoxin reductase